MQKTFGITAGTMPHGWKDTQQLKVAGPTNSFQCRFMAMRFKVFGTPKAVLYQ